MIIKNHEPNIRIDMLEALIRRLPDGDPRKRMVIQEQIREKAGVKGEKEVAFSLRFLDYHKYYIIHSIRLGDDNGTFQMDTLILTEKYILILEVKNWYGTILFGPNGQVTQIGDRNQEKGLSNPVTQAELQRYRLTNWLTNRGVTDIPIDVFSVISLPSTIIKPASPSDRIPPEVIHTNQLLFKIKELDNKYANRPKLQTNMKRLAQHIASSHIQRETCILEDFELTTDELIKGIFCDKCQRPSMTRKYATWQCMRCGFTSKDAHLYALNEYRLLFGPQITNRQAREFLQVQPPHLIQYLLQKYNFQHTGRTKNRVYSLCEKIIKQHLMN